MPATRLHLGPKDDGRELTDDEYEGADYREGYRYELIDGRLDVSPTANFPEDSLRNWIDRALKDYSRARPDVANYVTTASRVFVPGRRRLTSLEPDVAAFRGAPSGRGRRQLDWRLVSPILVVEVLVDSKPRKDLVRNPPLYWAVGSIEEYWVVDGRADPDEPSLIVHRRHPGAADWDVITVPYGATYAPPALPGFALVIDPDA